LKSCSPPEGKLHKHAYLHKYILPPTCAFSKSRFPNFGTHCCMHGSEEILLVKGIIYCMG
jgi:hypothetical protein